HRQIQPASPHRRGTRLRCPLQRPSASPLTRTMSLLGAALPPPSSPCGKLLLITVFHEPNLQHPCRPGDRRGRTIHCRSCGQLPAFPLFVQASRSAAPARLRDPQCSRQQTVLVALDFVRPGPLAFWRHLPPVAGPVLPSRSSRFSACPCLLPD